MSEIKTRLDLLDHQVKNLEYANKLLFEGVVAGILCIMPRAEVWDCLQQEAEWARLKQEAAKAKGEE